MFNDECMVNQLLYWVVSHLGDFHIQEFTRSMSFCLYGISIIHQILSIFTSCQDYCKSPLIKQLSSANPLSIKGNQYMYKLLACWVFKYIFQKNPFTKWSIIVLRERAERANSTPLSTTTALQVKWFSSPRSQIRALKVLLNYCPDKVILNTNQTLNACLSVRTRKTLCWVHRSKV